MNDGRRGDQGVACGATLARLRHFATVLGLTPWRDANVLRLS